MALAWLVNLDFAAGEVEGVVAAGPSVDPLILPGSLILRRYADSEERALRRELTLKSEPRRYGDG